jgi:hypothetical protein
MGTASELLQIVFVSRGVDDNLFAIGAAVAFNVMHEEGGSQIQSIRFGLVGEHAETMLSIAPDCTAAVEISVQHFCFAERTLHGITALVFY